MKKLLALVAALALVGVSVGCDGGGVKETPVIDKPATPGGGQMSSEVKTPAGVEGKPAGGPEAPAPEAPAPEGAPAPEAPAPEAPAPEAKPAGEAPAAEAPAPEAKP
ncbi:MAG: hypothetical protein U0939_12970 [Pirellulales bacterium]